MRFPFSPNLSLLTIRPKLSISFFKEVVDWTSGWRDAIFLDGAEANAT